MTNLPLAKALLLQVNTGLLNEWVLLKLESGAWEDTNESCIGIGGRDAYWDSSLEWNTFEYEFTISQVVADAGSVLMYPECPNLDALMVFNDVSVHCI